jgi:hypothetical protein
VSASNGSALDAARLVLSLDEPLRPDELGTPWEFSSHAIVTFTEDHDDSQDARIFHLMQFVIFSLEPQMRKRPRP